MKINTKMIISGATLSFMSALFGCIFVAKIAIHQGQLSLEEDAKQSLAAIRDITATEVTNYLNGIQNQAITVAENLMTIKAMIKFSTHFNDHANTVSDEKLTGIKDDLKTYYNEQFSRQFQTLNNGKKTAC